MKVLSPKPDATACVSVLTACRTNSALATGIDVHNYITSNSLLLQSIPAEASKREDQHLLLYTGLMNMYRHCGKPEAALSLWHQMCAWKVQPNKYIYCTLLGVCASLLNLQAAEEIYAHVQQNHIRPDIAIYNALIYIYTKCGIPSKALSIWQRLQNMDGITPNISTLTNVLLACTENGSLEVGKAVHRLLSQQGLHDPTVISTLIKMYSECEQYFLALLFLAFN